MSVSSHGRPASARAARAAAVAAIVLGVLWGGYALLTADPSCDADRGGCFGYALLGVAVGVPVAVALVAWGLRGKGPAHALVGSLVCLAVGWRLSVAGIRLVGWTPPDALASLATVPLTALLVAAWAAYVPGSTGRADAGRR